MNKEKLEKRILALVSRAGVVEPLPGGQGTLASEPILVLYGKNKSGFEVFDQYGHAVGNAERIRGHYSRDGYQYRYVVRDTQPRFTLTDISKGRGASTPESFVLAAPDGSHIASAHRPTRLAPERVLAEALTEYESFVFEHHNETLGTFHKTSRKERRRVQARPAASSRLVRFWQLLGSKLFHVEDRSNRHVATITYFPASIGSWVGYVLELQRGAQERFSTIAIAACIIADNAFVDTGGGGGGGAA
jgi:hypothetical protein